MDLEEKIKNSIMVLITLLKMENGSLISIKQEDKDSNMHPYL